MNFNKIMSIVWIVFGLIVIFTTKDQQAMAIGCFIMAELMNMRDVIDQKTVIIKAEDLDKEENKRKI